MILILLGPPGAGKGTQGARITQRCGIPKISTGEIFRDLAAAGTSLGVQARDFWAAGKLVPDEIVVGLVRDRIRQEDCRNGFVLDGFPRTVRQADILNELLTGMGCSLSGVFDYCVEAEELIHRLSGRRTCPNCSATYHVTEHPSRVEGVCDHCGAMLVQRSDDTPEAIRIRLREYAAKTAALLEYYDERSILHRIDANASPEQVFQSQVAALAAMGCP